MIKIKIMNASLLSWAGRSFCSFCASRNINITLLFAVKFIYCAGEDQMPPEQTETTTNNNALQNKVLRIRKLEIFQSYDIGS